MNYATARLIAGYSAICAGAVAIALMLACELGAHPALTLHGNLFG